MRHRLSLLMVVGAASLSLTVTGCGTEEPVSTPASASSVAKVADEGDCDCTGATRARERVADGRATKRTGTVTLGG